LPKLFNLIPLDLSVVFLAPVVTVVAAGVELIVVVVEVEAVVPWCKYYFLFSSLSPQQAL